MKKIIRKLANKFGYDFIKTNEWSEKNITKKVSVRVGNYDILMPGNNQQIVNYKNIPDLNIQLGHLAECVAKKYPDVTLIDVGANVGDTIAIIKTNIDLPIIAIEGDDTSFQFLEMNTKQFKNISLVKAFLGETKETIGVDIEKSGWNNTIIPNASGKKKIILDTLDNTLENLKLNRGNLKLLKIDTEGFDTIILRGCNNILKNNKPVIFFEYNGENMKKNGENGLETILNLKKVGYHQILIFDGLSNLILSTNLDNEALLLQLHNYVHKKGAMIPFFDICIFHSEDTNIANDFVNFGKENK
jgi:FkbM family methyltransferase